MAKFIDETGNVYGHLTVVAQAKSNNGAYWLCQCDCGNTCVVSGGNLRGGETISCGCHRRRFNGNSNTPEYHAWYAMQQRCNDEDHYAFHNYGGRGISVCDRWSDFNLFLEDMGKRPGPKYSLDRIDNDGNYEPSNCRWVTMEEQARNKRTNTRLTFNGETKTVSEWASALGYDRHTLGYRFRRGWSDEEILTTPRQSANKIEFNGESKTMREWAQTLGMKTDTLRARFKAGWSTEKALTTPPRKWSH